MNQKPVNKELLDLCTLAAFSKTSALMECLLDRLEGLEAGPGYSARADAACAVAACVAEYAEQLSIMVRRYRDLDLDRNENQPEENKHA